MRFRPSILFLVLPLVFVAVFLPLEVLADGLPAPEGSRSADVSGPAAARFDFDLGNAILIRAFVFRPHPIHPIFYDSDGGGGRYYVVRCTGSNRPRCGDLKLADFVEVEAEFVSDVGFSKPKHRTRPPILTGLTIVKPAPDGCDADDCDLVPGHGH